jgi:hypothetical protein
MRCNTCKQPLAGGTDTFGKLTTPLCQSCWLDYASLPDETQIVKVNQGVTVIAGPRRGAIYTPADYRKMVSTHDQ